MISMLYRGVESIHIDVYNLSFLCFLHCSDDAKVVIRVKKKRASVSFLLMLQNETDALF